MIARAQRLFSPEGLREPEPLAVLSHGKGQQSTALGYMPPFFGERGACAPPKAQAVRLGAVLPLVQSFGAGL